MDFIWRRSGLLLLCFSYFASKFVAFLWGTKRERGNSPAHICVEFTHCTTAPLRLFKMLKVFKSKLIALSTAMAFPFISDRAIQSTAPQVNEITEVDSSWRIGPYVRHNLFLKCFRENTLIRQMFKFLSYSFDLRIPLMIPCWLMMGICHTQPAAPVRARIKLSLIIPRHIPPINTAPAEQGHPASYLSSSGSLN